MANSLMRGRPQLPANRKLQEQLVRQMDEMMAVSLATQQAIEEIAHNHIHAEGSVANALARGDMVQRVIGCLRPLTPEEEQACVQRRKLLMRQVNDLMEVSGNLIINQVEQAAPHHHNGW